MKIKEYYEKNKLPDFNRYNPEFGFEQIEEGNFAKEISERILEKIEKYRKILEEFINTDGSSLSVLIELKAVDENDRDEINSLFKELIVIERGFLITELQNSESAYLAFIRDTLKKWDNKKPKLLGIIQKLRDSWKSNINIKENLGYLG